MVDAPESAEEVTESIEVEVEVAESEGLPAEETVVAESAPADEAPVAEVASEEAAAEEATDAPEEDETK